MKCILALILCGVTYCLAQPPCTKHWLECFINLKNYSLDMEEGLDNNCRDIQCVLQYVEKCGKVVEQPPPSFYASYKKFYSSLCSKENPLRKKFLENAHCLNTLPGKVTDECKDYDLPSNHEALCKKLPEILECAGDVVTKTCGEDSKDAFFALYPGYEYYLCTQ